MNEPPAYVILGEARDCDQLIEIYRDRKRALGLTDKWFDAHSGLAQGHIGKLLGDGQVKRLGSSSISTINLSLAVKFLVVIDDEQVGYMAARWEGREFAPRTMPATASIRALERFRPIITREIINKITPLGGKARMASMTAKQRTALARRAARRRWANKKAEIERLAAEIQHRIETVKTEKPE